MAPVQPSPPKRMTRARAKAVENNQKITKVTAPSTKVAATAAKKKTAKGKATAPAQDEKSENECQAWAKPPSKKGGAQSRATRVVKEQNPARGSTRSSRAKTTNTGNRTMQQIISKDEQHTVSRARGCPKRVSLEKEDSNRTTNPGDHVDIADPPTNRMRTEADTTEARGPMKSTVAKKKVTFNEKENVIDDLVNGKLTVGNAGKSQRVRKPTANSGSVKRGKLSDAESKTHKRLRSEPLSPKKDTQVAKGHGETVSCFAHMSQLPTSSKQVQAASNQSMSPGKQINQFNNRDSPENTHLGSSVDELQMPDAPPMSSLKNQSFSLVSNPPRPLPSSPTKESIKSPPRKIIIQSGSGLDPRQSQLQPINRLSTSPQKFNLGTSRNRSTYESPSQNNIGSSLARSSPRRPPSPIKNIGPEARNQTPAGNTKASLLHSSARRPPSSIRSMVLGLTMKSTTLRSSINPVAASEVRKTPVKFDLSPCSRNLTPSFKAARSPISSTKPCEITLKEKHSLFQDELNTAPSPFTPATQKRQRLSIPQSMHHRKSPVARRVSDADRSALGMLGLQSATPTMTPPRIPSHLMEDPFVVRPETPDSLGDSSDDELQTLHHSFNFLLGSRRHDPFLPVESPATPAQGIEVYQDPPKTGNNKLAMTALADRFGAWTTSTPSIDVFNQKNIQESVAHYPHVTFQENQKSTSPNMSISSGQGQNHFEEAMRVHEDEDELMQDARTNEDNTHSGLVIKETENKDNRRKTLANDNKFDSSPENAGTLEQYSLILKQDQRNETCSNEPSLEHVARDVVSVQHQIPTPIRPIALGHPVTHNTSKIPLKPAAGVSESLFPQTKSKRSTKSLLSTLAPPDYQGTQLLHELPKGDLGDSRQSAKQSIEPKPRVNPNLLAGAVMYIDVHTNEGADASGIFHELLIKMGAKCVKQWNWNPSSDVEAEGENACEDDEAEDSRPGITHVVFKDGGVRTMEKVRAAQGLVHCVGVNWVLRCEEFNEWIDESEYAVDITHVPRGGHRRRKSMEPRSVSRRWSSANSFPTCAQQDVSLSRRASHNLDRAKLDSGRPAAERVDGHTVATVQTPPATPNPKPWEKTPNGGNSTNAQASPTTPYFLHDPAKIQQQTCPPKQDGRSFFPVTGRIEDESDEPLKKKLLWARRRTLQFAPQVGSPLKNRVRSVEGGEEADDEEL